MMLFNVYCGLVLGLEGLTMSIPRSFRWQVLLFFLAALCIRFAFLFQDLDSIDRVFLPDDTYYTLSISRSLATGQGPQIGGTTHTNGFQPLIAFLQIPYFWFSGDLDGGVKYAVMLSAVMGSLSTIIVGLLMFNLGGKKAATVAMLLWASCPIIVLNDLNGLETSLSGLFALLLLLQLIRFKESRSLLNVVGTGIVCGLMLLARVDNCFLIGLAGLYILFLYGIRTLLLVGVTALITVSPWWLYSYVEFGTVIPQSGDAVRELVTIIDKGAVHNIGLGLWAMTLWLPFGFFINDNLLFSGVVLFLSFVLTVAFIVSSLRYLHKVDNRIILIAAAVSGILFLFYTLYLPAFWFFTRYFYFIYAVMVILFSVFYLHKENELSTSPEKKLKYKVFKASIVIVLLANVAALSGFIGGMRPTANDLVLGAKSYKSTALALLEKVPDNSVIGAFQSGALSYFAPPSKKVLNLDGVVNNAAHESLVAGTMGLYMAEAGVTYFTDWPGNTKIVKARYGQNWDDKCFQKVYSAPPQHPIVQDKLTFELFKIGCDTVANAAGVKSLNDRASQ